MFHFLPVQVVEAVNAAFCLYFFHVFVDVSLGEALAIGLVLPPEHLDIRHIVKPTIMNQATKYNKCSFAPTIYLT